MEEIGIKFELGHSGEYGNSIQGVLEVLSADESLRIKKFLPIIRNAPSLDPTIIVAGIGAISTVVSSLVTYFVTRNTGQIVIRGKDGTTVEVPRGTKKEDLEHYVNLARKLDAPVIVVEKK